jgi:hypothetical protein
MRHLLPIDWRCAFDKPRSGSSLSHSAGQAIRPAFTVKHDCYHMLRVVANMVPYVDPGPLSNHPLLMRAVVPGDFAVYIHGLPVGRIFLKSADNDRAVWFWTITGPHIPVHLLPAKGQADTLAKAKKAFRTKFSRWHEWAETLGHEVVWNDKV